MMRMVSFVEQNLLNFFHATGFVLYPLKTSENLCFSDFFRGYRKRPVAWNGLILSIKNILRNNEIYKK